MTVRRDIRFLLNGEAVNLSEVRAADTLLDYIRLARRMTGTKEGCAEGDCGACTVLVGRLRDGVLGYEPVNACIRFLASLDGCHVVTIEHLRDADGGLHPVQQAMVDFHGSQCGFCTPGFVMALYALWMRNPDPTESEVETALQGNLCRCTGYEPIVRAAMAASRYGDPAEDRLQVERATVIAQLSAFDDGQQVELRVEDDLAILPADVDDLADALIEHPGATLVAGATDVGLWVTKLLRPISPAIFIGHLDGLKRIDVADDAVTIGAGASYSDCTDVMAEVFPHLREYWDRIAGWQVRSMGTLGGNIANGSPIGDVPPVLIALSAEIVLRHGAERRRVALEDFFIDYGEQDRAGGEFVEEIRIPRIAEDSRHAAYKISKRRDEDISSLCAGFNITVANGTITEARIAFGGMAATPKRACHGEAALIGKPWSAEALGNAAAVLSEDFTPLTDWRASAEYRMLVAKNLFHRFWLEQGDAPEAVRLSRREGHG